MGIVQLRQDAVWAVRSTSNLCQTCSDGKVSRTAWHLDEHFGALQRVLKAHQDARLKLQPEKCQLFKDSIQHLGHVVSKNGIQPMQEYLEIVKTWPLPKTRNNQVRAFLGKIGYYLDLLQEVHKELCSQVQAIDGQIDTGWND